MRDKIRAQLGIGESYRFHHAPSIRSQALTFAWNDREFVVQADSGMPLYDTISELVDFDSYQLAKIRWPSGRDITILDIGANIGVFALLLSTVPRSTVHCFEPVPSNCRWLRTNLTENSITNARVIEKAVSDKDGTASFAFATTENVGGSLVSLREQVRPDESVIQVKTLSVESALREVGGDHVDLIKLDCEGAEHDIVASLSAANASRISNLTMEVHDLGEGRNLATISRNLESLGYRLDYRRDLFGRPALHHLLACT